jgi:hypothetical protein
MEIGRQHRWRGERLAMLAAGSMDETMVMAE